MRHRAKYGKILISLRSRSRDSKKEKHSGNNSLSMKKASNASYRKKIGVQTVEDISNVVKHNLCTGCGICAAICPTGSLRMELNEDGEFVPFLALGCEECNLCASVCPQLSWSYNIQHINKVLSKEYREILGSSDDLNTFAGYAVDLDRRLRSSSGGILTLLLQHLLGSNKIDVAIVVGPANTSNGLLFEAKIVRTTEELEKCAGSKYYPIELSKAFHKLKSTKERAAIVGLPCHVRAIRLLMEKSKGFKNQIKYIFGLVCGHGVSAHFTDMLITAVGVSSNSIDSVVYRGKQNSKTASNYTFFAYNHGRMIGKPISFNDSPYGAAWVRRLFVPYVCDFCTDVFAEEADATFMDAWLPEYSKDPRGTSLIISRNAQVNEILRDLFSSGLANLWEVVPDDIIRSQAGVIRFKRELLPSRVYSALSRSKPVPEHLIIDFAIKGTRAQRKENNCYERYRKIVSFFWRLQLPALIRLKIIMFLTGPGIIQRSRSLLKRILGKKGKILMISILQRIKNVKG